MIEVPGTLGWWRKVDGGAAWLERLPTIAAECTERWALTLGVPISTIVSLVIPATRSDGRRLP